MANAAKPQRRPRVATCAPLSEAQLVDVQRVVARLKGTGARSVKVHGLIVYLDKGPAIKHGEAKKGAHLTTGAAMPQQLSEMNASQRRSRRRLETRIALNSAKVQERPLQAQGEDAGLAAMRTAMGHMQTAPESSSSNCASPTHCK